MFRTITLGSILIALAGLLFLAAPHPPAQAQSTTPEVPGFSVTPVSGGDKLDVSWNQVTR